MVEIIRLLARPQWENERFTPRVVNNEQLRQLAGGDPPPDFPSWEAYYSAVLYERRRLTTFATPTAIPHGRKASLVWARDGEDVATIGMHFLHADGSAAADFTDDDEVTINGFLATMWAALVDVYPAATTLDRIIWHNWGVGIRRPNPATNEYAATGTVAGTADHDAQLPPQAACSVTFKTSVRRQWGRVYLPAPYGGTIVAGRFLEAFCDQVRTAFGTLLDAAAAADLPLVVWSPRHAGNALSYGDGTPAGRAAAHEAGLDNPDSTSFARSVLQVQVDDVVDEIRSRRFSKAMIRATHTL